MIILAGAPEPANLDWSEKSLLPSVSQVETAPTSTETQSTNTDKPFTAQWRQLATDRLQMRPVLPKLNLTPIQPGPAESQDTEFFTPSDFLSQESPTSDVSRSASIPSGGSAESTAEGLSDFYDHSFSIHEAVPSSEVSELSTCTPGTPVFEAKKDMFPQLEGRSIIRTPSQRRLSQAPRPNGLTTLGMIPNSAYLDSIAPQTMTVNLMVALLSISPTRKVTTGKGFNRPREMELVELTVGDDTKANFNITMWLPREMHVNWKDGANAQPEGSRCALRRNLKMLQSRDIVLLQNVALSCYRGKVHGQSLRGDVTKIDLLFRKKIEEDDMQGCYSVSTLRSPTDPQIKRCKAVRDWMNDFIGEPDVVKKRGRKGGMSRMMLPDDTQ